MTRKWQTEDVIRLLAEADKDEITEVIRDTEY
jgi:hypothetical protein